MMIGIVTPVANKSVFESASVPVNSSARHTAFHPGDFTHPCHLLYVHPSDILGASLVSVSFDGTCYGSLRRNILVALFMRNKLDFINSTTERPPVGSSLARQWQRCNDLVVSWYCKKQGHTIEKCYKFHGFPPNFKFSKTTGPRKMAANIEVEKSGFLGASGGSDVQPQSQSEQLFAMPGLTIEQYCELMIMLQQSHLSSSSSTLNLLASANFAGELLPESGLFRTCLLTKIENILWIIDSGASDHMTSNKSLLLNTQTLPIPYLVSLPNGYKVKVTNIGFLTLSPNLILHNVLYIPSFHYNLISVYKLVARPGHIVEFTNVGCTFQGPSLKKPVVLGRPENGLYKLFQLPATSFSCNSSTFSIIPCSIPCNVSPVECSNISSVDANMFSDAHVHTDHALLNKVNKEDVFCYSYIRAFGYIFYYIVPKTHKDKFQPRALSYVFLGYVFANKGYKLYNLETNSCLVFRDIVFHEHIFPFLQSSSCAPSICPFPFSACSNDFPLTSSYVPSLSPICNGSPLLTPVSTSSALISPPSSSSIFSVSPSSYVSAPSSSPPLPPSSPSPPTLRRSTRVHKQTSYLQSYVCHSSSLDSSSVFSNSPFSQQLVPEPFTYSQAALIPEWQDVMRKEFEALEANQT
uniref:Uncharacterized protein LOC104218332 n=1 Tax=Nicotiana sylvestris TaxID=4096 RepID=A0A1U7VXJ8_NICSY|nr:PREDICTED: uncharacterized protein LOC104218332 [Nicotiana sylvestris]